MIDLYFWPTPNGRKITIMLEETGLPYAVKPVAIDRGAQFSDEFARINPNRRVPAIVDHAPSHGSGPLVIFESGAILLYLAEKSGRFLPQDKMRRWSAIQWLMWQMSSIGPMLGQYGYFLRYADERVPHAIARYEREVVRLYSVLDRRLSETDGFVAGAYSIADMALFPWIMTHKAQQIAIDNYPSVAAWYKKLRARPRLQAGLEVGQSWLKPMLSHDAKQNLFERKPS
jgi:GST-like protein